MVDINENIDTDSNDRHKGFIKELIRIAFVFGHDKNLFHKKVFEAFNVNSLKEKGIVQIEEDLLEEDLRNALNEHKLSEKEFELCCLLAQGFSPDEITVMLGLKNSRSVYVKQSRINKKLKAEASQEIMFVMLVLSIITYMLLLSFNASGF